MSVISIETAMQHLRADEDDAFLVQAYLDAAEDSAAQFMGRYFFSDADALELAKAEITTRRAEAHDAYRLAVDAASSITDESERLTSCRIAEEQLSATLSELDKLGDGIVINPSIAAACLLITGNLFANREDVVVGSIATVLPMGSRALLFPYRVGLGV